MERLVERAYSAFGEEARRRGIDYRRESRRTPVIVTDGDRVLQVISNLLANAFRWTPDGGHVGLALDQVERDGSDRGRRHGAGHSAEEQDRIFRPFWSRDGARHGPGLADRARARRRRSAARSSCRREAGKGSRFELVLPAKPNGPGCQSGALRSGRRSRRASSATRSSRAESFVDALPARDDQIDDQREVVHARVPLGE